MGLLRGSRGEYMDLYIPGVKEKKTKSGVKRVPCDVRDDLAEIVQVLGDGKYGAVVLDTYTKLTNMALREQLQEGFGDKEAKRVKVETKGGKTIYHPSQQDYGVIASTLDENAYELYQAAQSAQAYVMFVGHEKLLESTDIDGHAIDTFGSLATVGQQIMRGLPGNMLLLLKMRLRKAKKAGIKRPSVMIECVGDEAWQAKDRLGVLEDIAPIDVTVLKEKGEKPDAWKERIANLVADEVWMPWLEEAIDRQAYGFLGLYGPPGCGKTTACGGLVLAVADLMERPVLYVDADSEGSLALPKSLLMATGE